jgi:hypothetical protein
MGARWGWRLTFPILENGLGDPFERGASSFEKYYGDETHKENQDT